MLRLVYTLFAVALGLFCLCSAAKPNRTARAICVPKAVQVPLVQPASQAPLCLPLDKPPFRRKLIVIDAGHGGEDLGTQSSTKPLYNEKHLNLATAKMLDGFLRQMGYATVLTRSNDTFITLEKRADIANKLKCDLFIIVHYNSAPAKKAEGIEVFFYRDDKDKERAMHSKNAAQLVLNKIIENTEAKSRGVKHGDLSVIRNTKMPAILVEGGFLTNEEEMQRLKDPRYLKRIAWGIAQGVQMYLNQK
jgi:N-acetylmuramoyl-L-alanine amidase